MPQMTFFISPQAQLLIPVQISQYPLLWHQLRPREVPPPRTLFAQGLVDTGATISGIDHHLVQALSLPCVGVTTVLTPSTGCTPLACSLHPTTITIANLFQHSIEMTSSDLLHQGFQVLIGMDVLRTGRLFVDGPAGTFTIEFP